MQLLNQTVARHLLTSPVNGSPTSEDCPPIQAAECPPRIIASSPARPSLEWRLRLPRLLYLHRDDRRALHSGIPREPCPPTPVAPRDDFDVDTALVRLGDAKNTMREDLEVELITTHAPELLFRVLRYDEKRGDVSSP